MTIHSSVETLSSSEMRLCPRVFLNRHGVPQPHFFFRVKGDFSTCEDFSSHFPFLLIFLIIKVAGHVHRRLVLALKFI